MLEIPAHLETHGMELEHILPTNPEFTLKSTGKTYRLRLVTLADQVWMRKTFGTEDRVREVMVRTEWEEIAKIVYHQLEDKSDFLSVTKEDVNDEGDTVTLKWTGPVRLLEAVSGTSEGITILNALSAAFIAANPEAREQITSELKKKNLIGPSTGQKSSTSSRPSTAGASRKSRA